MECGGVDADPYKGMSGRLLGTPSTPGVDEQDARPSTTVSSADARSRELYSVNRAIDATMRRIPLWRNPG